MDTIIRGIAVYFIAWWALRITGKRAIDQMTPFEFLLMLMIGGITVPGMLIQERSFIATFLLLITLIGTHILINFLKRKSKLFSKIMDGTPIVIMENGQLLEKELDKYLITKEDILATARGQGITRFDQIKNAILERNGKITIISK